MYTNVKSNDSHKQNTTCMFIHIQKGNDCETFICIYKRPDTFQKSGPCLYIYINANLKNFMEIAKRLYVYTKGQTLSKKQDNLRYFFIHKSPDTLRSAIFHEIFEIGIDIYI